jgi:hypothetical protein
MKTLRICESLNFCNVFLKNARTASPETLVNALIDLALMVVQSTATPGTDHETMQVLAIYTADQALERSVTDFEKLIEEAQQENEKFENFSGTAQ